ncbi:hypothetical protein DL98DRAFT_594118 [Cadophora sp. DSE1049]|nr:hypothetical protein DL98DRAFT_594118 [Cadophora sp. DSE1049]
MKFSTSLATLLLSASSVTAAAVSSPNGNLVINVQFESARSLSTCIAQGHACERDEDCCSEWCRGYQYPGEKFHACE